MMTENIFEENERVTPFTGYPFDLSQPLSGQAMAAYHERVTSPLETIGRLAQKAMRRYQDTDAIIGLNGGQCFQCDHPPYQLRHWIVKHLKKCHD